MKTFVRPFTTRERSALKREITWTPGTIIFGLMCAGLILKLFHFLVSKLAASHPFFKPVWWWLAPWTALIAYILFSAAFGKRGWRELKRDMVAGNASCQLVEAVEAIEIEEQEDEGPGFFFKTAEGETIMLRGQYLEAYLFRSFPWKSFEIVETPEAKHFIGLRRMGEPIKPSFIREPLTWEEMKIFGFGDYKVLDVNFDSLKIKPSKNPPRRKKQTASTSDTDV